MSCLTLCTLENDTRQLICDFLKDFTTKSTQRLVESKALSTMKRVVKGILDKHRHAFSGMINNLSFENGVYNIGVVGAVARSLFRDGTSNWGRIVSLVAFGAVLCQHLKEKGWENTVDQVGQEIASYLLSYQKDWLLKNNSWDGFVEFFQGQEPEKAIRCTLLGFVGFAGLWATLALLMRYFLRFVW
ncbi:induced myeloid leukemia cell differentiation protein Mcl-1 homolog [Cynoglossus semilaevis]|uniref:induced myeloid leukemia cell differentiation protein Mcl-1 homolog n=1 Tax=Cynoglossus semilaevis TaxID=244447 RepID=UPI000496FCC6|nr:induced myeloid leukemia cell differentiation protein Mcl-1 homolog [Cynoglossus semilaevis]